MNGLQLVVEMAGMKYKDLANQIGVSPKTLNDWVKGRRKIPAKRLEQLKDIFGVEKNLYQKELTASEKLQIQIDDLYKNNEAVEIEEVITGDDGEEYKGKMVYHTNQTEIDFLIDQLKIAEAKEDIFNKTQELIETIEQDEDNFQAPYEIEKQLGIVKSLLCVLLERNTEKTEISGDIVYYLSKFYGKPVKTWRIINPLVDASHIGDLYKELDELLKKYYKKGTSDI